MPNRLIHETSPYLLQHAHNPVDWYPWGEEALTKARAENKPIFLSVGYAACHWCHVMEHESFENPQIAEMLNQHFVSIKVDREERPDIDSIYMNAVTAMTGSGGWPMSVFLTPEGRPFYGGTYFPPVRRYNLPSFQEILYSIERAWQEGKGDIYRTADRLANHLIESTAWTADRHGALQAGTLAAAAKELIRSYDHKNGGWGDAPKFPHPMVIEFLFQMGQRGNTQSVDTALHSLRMMARGGIYDVVGGGFHRYSTDERWLIPHFEKMLYDNGQLATAYLHGYLISRDASMRKVCEETLDFILREMTHPQGGFYSSLDADSEGVEGKFYVWTEEEIRAIVDDPADFDFLHTLYHLSPGGNFEGKIVLQRPLDDRAMSAGTGLNLTAFHDRLDRLHAKLLAARTSRVRPGTDDKVLVAWNALALQAFAQAARYLNRPDYLDAARKNAAFLLDAMFVDGRLLRSWRSGQARHTAYLEDYAGLIIALLDLYQSDADLRWFQAADNLGREMVSAFSDDRGGFFSTHKDQTGLILRPKEMQDNATPSGNALAAQALLLLHAYTGDDSYRGQVEPMLAGVQAVAAQYPAAFGYWLQTLDFALGPVRQVALVYPAGSAAVEAMRSVLWKDYSPRLIAAEGTDPIDHHAPELLQQRGLLDNQPTAYLCQGFACRLPVNSAEELQAQLDESDTPSGSA